MLYCSDILLLIIKLIGPTVYKCSTLKGIIHFLHVFMALGNGDCVLLRDYLTRARQHDKTIK